MKRIALLSLLTVAYSVMALTPVTDVFWSQRTKDYDLFHAIETGNQTLLDSALAQGADINSIHPETGNTPLMQAICNLFSSTISYNDKRATVNTVGVLMGIGGGIFSGILIGSHNNSTLSAWLGGIGAGIGISFLSSTAMARLFLGKKKAYCTALKHSIIGTLISHQSINLAVKNPFTGYDAHGLVQSILRPSYITYTSTSYTTSHAQIFHGFGVAHSTPHTTLHTQVKVTVNDECYTMDESIYQETIAPLAKDLIKKIRARLAVR